MPTLTPRESWDLAKTVADRFEKDPDLDRFLLAAELGISRMQVLRFRRLWRDLDRTARAYAIEVDLPQNEAIRIARLKITEKDKTRAALERRDIQLLAVRRWNLRQERLQKNGKKRDRLRSPPELRRHQRTILPPFSFVGQVRTPSYRTAREYVRILDYLREHAPSKEKQAFYEGACELLRYLIGEVHGLPWLTAEDLARYDRHVVAEDVP